MRKFYLFVSICLSSLLLFGLWSALTFQGAAAAAPDAAAVGAKAQVIVEFGPQQRIVREISFTAPISGLLALQLTGLEVVTADFGFGPAVCSVNGVGCPADDCFCDSNRFWGNSYWEGGVWTDYLVGAADSTIVDGAVEGWRWGEFGGSLPPAPPLTATLPALDWLAALQLDDGGYGTLPGSSVNTAISIGANGIRVADWHKPDQASLLHYFMGRGTSYAAIGAAEAGKLAVGLASSQGCWPLHALQPADYYSSATGQYADPGDAGFQSWAILGTRALSESVPTGAVTYLKSLQDGNGGWEWQPGFGTDTNTTALAVQALIAAGESPTSTAVISGLNYLKNAQNTDGGFPYDVLTTESDTNSTALTILAIRAAGQDPITGTWTISSTNPIEFLLTQQLPDGSFQWLDEGQGNLFATQQAIPALLGNPFPLTTSGVAECLGLYLPATPVDSAAVR